MPSHLHQFNARNLLVQPRKTIFMSDWIHSLIMNPWPWYVSGPLIALVMILLLWLGGYFGVSSSLRMICSMGGAGRFSSFFTYDWKGQRWHLAFLLGVVLGGYISSQWMTASDYYVAISSNTIDDLKQLGIEYSEGLAPLSLFSWSSLASVQGILVLVVGGFLIGFGTRWAGGCTSGHAISGLSNLQLPSLIAVIGFFIGGLLMTHLVFPLLFN